LNLSGKYGLWLEEDLEGLANKVHEIISIMVTMDEMRDASHDYSGHAYVSYSRISYESENRHATMTMSEEE